MTIFGAWARHARMLIKVQAGVGATLSLFYVSLKKNSRPEAVAFIRSLQTGFLGKKVEEQIEVDYNRVEEGRGRKCNRFSYGHLYPMRPVGFRVREKDEDAGWETQRIKPLAVVSTLFDPQQSRPC